MADKTTDTKTRPFVIRIPHEAHKALKAAAMTDGRSMGNFLVHYGLKAADKIEPRT